MYLQLLSMILEWLVLMNKEKILALLPWIMRKNLKKDSPLDTIVSIMAGYVKPVDDKYTNLNDFFNPLLTTPEMVYHMACWFKVDWIFGRGTLGLITSQTLEGQKTLLRLRRIVSDIEYIIWWKGTSKGLKFLLERVLDISDIEIENHDFHFNIKIDKKHNLDLDLLNRVVEHEKPAPMTWSMELI